MLKGKELILEIINNALLAEQAGSDLQQLTFDNTELNAFLTNYKNPSDDIIYLTDGMLNNIIKYIDPVEEQKKFMVTIKYIRGISQLNKEKESKIPLSDNQLLKLAELIELIKKVVERNEYLTTHLKERSEKQINDYRQILGTIQNENIFTADDYEVVEEIVRSETPVDAESNLDLIFTFLNEFNSRKLKEIVTDKKEEFSLLQTSEIKENEANDIFEAVVRPSIPKTITKLESAERVQKIKEILAYLGYNYDKLDLSLKLKLISIKDLDALNELAKYLKEDNPEFLINFKSKNEYGLIYLLINSNEKIITEVINILKKDYNILIQSSEFKKIVNTLTTIFSEKGLINFKSNNKIFVSYKASLRKIIRDNISLLTTNPKNLNRTIHKLEKRGANIKLVFDRYASILEQSNIYSKTLIENNLSILEMYGFDLDAFFTEESPCFTVLYSSNLAAKLDQFIEVGLNEYIHNSPLRAGTAFKSLITKRIYYAFKNNYEVWSSSKKTQKQLSSRTTGPENSPIVYPRELVETSIPKNSRIENENYNNAIDNSTLIISDTEIEKIKSMHPIMLLIEEGYRAAIYTDAPMGLLKRKTEYIFGTQIISRPKVFKIFKILTDLGVEKKEALLYAITYNSILEPQEFEFIKKAVDRIGVDGNYDRLLKTI